MDIRVLPRRPPPVARRTTPIRVPERDHCSPNPGGGDPPFDGSRRWPTFRRSLAPACGGAERIVGLPYYARAPTHCCALAVAATAASPPAPSSRLPAAGYTSPASRLLRGRRARGPYEHRPEYYPFMPGDPLEHDPKDGCAISSVLVPPGPVQHVTLRTICTPQTPLSVGSASAKRAPSPSSSRKLPSRKPRLFRPTALVRPGVERDGAVLLPARAAARRNWPPTSRPTDCSQDPGGGAHRQGRPFFTPSSSTLPIAVRRGFGEGWWQPSKV